MSVTFKLSVNMPYDVHLFACEHPTFANEVNDILKQGYSDDYYHETFISEFDSCEKAFEADTALQALVDKYSKLHTQSLVREMTLTEIEAILGHPVKIIK